MSERKSQRATHKGCGAGAGDDNRQYAGEKTPSRAGCSGEPGAKIHPTTTQQDEARQGETHQREEVGKTNHESCGLQLEAPAHPTASGLQADQDAGDQNKRRHDADQISDAVPAVFSGVASGKTQYFE